MWSAYDNSRQELEHFESGNRRRSWRSTGWRRANYTRRVNEDDQRLLPYARPDTVLHANFGQGGSIDPALTAAGRADLTELERFIELNHGRGRNELVHRALRDFRAE